MNSDKKVLCVDDEPNILSAFRRQLKGKFDLEIITSPESALEHLRAGNKYAVIVSDMRMPTMDGAEFLKEVRNICPETTRVMLTGNIDQETAAEAINQGKIFRFLNKPCSSDQLSAVLHEAVEYHALITSEKDILQNTLSGSIKILTDILSIVDPVAFGKGAKLRQPVRDICKELQITNVWELELSAMLSVVGWVIVPERIKLLAHTGKDLSAEESEMIQSIPEQSSNLIKAIPRLQSVAKIILYSTKNYDGTGFPSDEKSAENIPLGSRILKIISSLIDLESKGYSRTEALNQLLLKPSIYDTKIIQKLLTQGGKSSSQIIPTSYEIKAKELCVGQKLMADLVCLNGKLLLTSGTNISALQLQSIMNYSETIGLKLPILVDSRIPLAEQDNKGIKI